MGGSSTLKAVDTARPSLNIFEGWEGRYLQRKMRRITKKKCFITWRSRPWRTTRRRISRRAVTSLQSFTTTSHFLAQNNILTSRPTLMELLVLILAFDQARAAEKEKRCD